MDTSAFEQITSSLTVRTICNPVGPSLPAGTSVYELEEIEELKDQDWDLIDDPLPIVSDDGSVVGMLWATDTFGDPQDDEGETEWTTVDEIMRSPAPFMSSDTTVLEAVGLFGSTDAEVFYVIHANKVVGVLRYRDLFYPLGRLAFLALALEIEDLALKLCQSPPVREHCWQAIPDNRKLKAKTLFKAKQGREPKLEQEVELRGRKRREWEADIDKLIECTNLVDKATMIWKRELVARTTRVEVLHFFNSLNNIRNRCAHPGAEGPPIPKQELADFVSQANRMRQSLIESMRSRGVSLARKKAATFLDPEDDRDGDVEPAT